MLKDVNDSIADAKASLRAAAPAARSGDPAAVSRYLGGHTEVSLDGVAVVIRSIRSMVNVRPLADAGCDEPMKQIARTTITIFCICFIALLLNSTLRIYFLCIL